MITIVAQNTFQRLDLALSSIEIVTQKEERGSGPQVADGPLLPLRDNEKGGRKNFDKRAKMTFSSSSFKTTCQTAVLRQKRRNKHWKERAICSDLP